MGTRGAYGFRINGQDKVSYHHFDSYPTGLGIEIMNFISKTSIEEMKEIAEKIILVEQGSVPTEKQIKVCEPYTNLDVSNRSKADWYCLLREAQGNLDVHKNIPYMIDSKEFLADSLFCEWAYIVNLDNGMLEIYIGFNHNKDAKGRYASLSDGSPYREGRTPYYGVVLINEITLESLYKATESKIKRKCEAIEKLVKKIEEKEKIAV